MEDKLKHPDHLMHARRMGISTYKEPVVYLNEHCHACKSEGFHSNARIMVTVDERTIIASLNTIHHHHLLARNEVGFSEHAWELLGGGIEGAIVHLSHPPMLVSLEYIRKKIYSHALSAKEINAIVHDLVLGRLSDLHIAAFLSACAGGRMQASETISMTEAMIQTGKRLHWDAPIVVDKHCIGGLPGNRTTPIIVPIIAAYGLLMPKTSSRAITSPAGTADTMSVLTTVDLSLEKIQTVVKKTQACMVWGGAVGLSPADDLLIRVERALKLDSEGQLVASVLSKKVAAGSTHILIDIPVGPTAKVRSMEDAHHYKHLFEEVAKHFNVVVNVIFSDGSQPIGYGIGPALEARDVMAVLKQEPTAPKDLLEKSLSVAAHLLCFATTLSFDQAYVEVKNILESGRALAKFIEICEAQGGLKEIPVAKYQEPYLSQSAGTVTAFDNRAISRLAGLAGAPHCLAAGVDCHVNIGDKVDEGTTLLTIHADSQGELNYAMSSLAVRAPIITVSSSYDS